MMEFLSYAIIAWGVGALVTIFLCVYLSVYFVIKWDLRNQIEATVKYYEIAEEYKDQAALLLGVQQRKLEALENAQKKNKGLSLCSRCLRFR